MTPDLHAIDRALPVRIRAALEAFEVPGAVIAVVRGDQDYLMTYGATAHDRDDPVRPDTPFDVGSCAKSYVSAAVAILASEGKLSLDDPVRRYVPELELDDPWISDHITLRDFLSNRTGLMRQRPIEAFPNAELSVLDIIARMGRLRRVHPFRAGFVYFNLGFMTAALAVERVSGMPYAQFLAEKLFAPLGMTASASGSLAYRTLQGRALGHTLQDGRVHVIADMIFDSTQGAGCVHSSGADALRWLRFHMREQGAGIVSPALMRELHSPHTIMPSEETGLMHRVPEASLCDYCLGWWTSQLGEHRLVQHSGGMFGWRAMTSFLPGADIGVAVYLNSARNVHHAIAYMVLEAMLGRPIRDWTRIAQDHAATVARDFTQWVAQVYPLRADAPELTLDACGGRYVHPVAGQIEIVHSGDGLLMKQLDGRLWDLALTPVGGGLFEAIFDNIAVRDYMPAAGRVRFVADGGEVVAFEEPGTRYERCD